MNGLREEVDGFSLTEILEPEDYLLLAAVVGLPWAFGGVQIWAFRLAALLIVSAAAVVVFRRGAAGLALTRRAGWLLPAPLLGLWGLVQLTPMPPAVVGLLSPRADAIYRMSFPGYPAESAPPTQRAIEDQALARVPEIAGLDAPADGPLAPEMAVGGRWSGWRGLALVPHAGIERVCWFSALLVAFVVARARCRDPEVADAYRKVLFVLFFSLAVFGLVYAATSNGKLYWVRTTLDASRPFGPYVNPTNFAGVMELAVPWLAGYTWLSWSTRSRTTPLRETRLPFLLAATAVCALAALATASKAAALLSLGALAAVALVAAVGWRRRLVVVAAVVVATSAAGLLLRFAPLGARVRDFVEATGGNVSQVDRVVAWRAGLDLLREFPVTGVGFGSFGDVFPAYLPAGEFLRWSHLHNDYLELALEGGVVAVALALWLAVAYWRRVLAGAGRQTDGGRSNLAHVGLLAGVAALTIHALFDFNHQIPANGLLFTVLAAIAVTMTESRARSGR